MPVVIDGNNTPTAGGIGYGDGTELAFTAAGTASQVLTSSGAGTPTWTTLASGLAAATQAEMEATSSNTVAATPSNTQFHPGVAKCWLVTAGAGSPSITASRNITSITDDGVGLLTVTIATDFSSDQIAAVATARVGAGTTPYFITYNSASGGSGQLKAYDAAGAAFDVDGYAFVAFGDQA
jgi:microcompartment protein CcmK/EutM